MENVREIIRKSIQIHSMTAHVGVGFKNLKTNEDFYINGDDTFPSASVYKILVLIELFNQKTKNIIDLNTRYKYSPKEISLGSGVLHELSETIELSYRDYATLMMIISDNTAADVVLNKVGRNNVKLMIDYLGLENTRVDLTCNDLLLGMYGVTKNDSYEQMQQKIKQKNVKKDSSILVNCEVENNVTSPRDMVEVFSKIYNKEILDNISCEDIIDIIKSCQTNSRIPRYIPGNVDIAHKTGTLDRIANDVGIIYTDATDYIFAVFYNGNMADDENYNENIKGTAGEQFIADLSKELYDYLSNEKLNF